MGLANAKLIVRRANTSPINRPANHALIIAYPAGKLMAVNQFVSSAMISTICKVRINPVSGVPPSPKIASLAQRIKRIAFLAMEDFNSKTTDALNRRLTAVFLIVLLVHHQLGPVGYAMMDTI
jgi:hypothetical protein